ncbi:hypothetical protein M0R45_001510 [Rubus argutus]|uniref:Protein kinase domain-containing protein n=1 Tax=Rubus argutus TaxID=59490 RepID=A0AAW1VIG0_RUBAR
MHTVVAEKGIREYSKKGIRVGKYELGKTLGEGNFSKVKFATDVQIRYRWGTVLQIKQGGRLTETEGRKLFQQLIDGVSYCHKQGVFHRDLKLENILLDSTGNIKICDFGFSALPQHFRSDGLLHTACGTPNYVAPEILANKGYDGAAADIWSCGVILFAILSGYLPFLDRNLAALIKRSTRGKSRYPNGYHLVQEP